MAWTGSSSSTGGSSNRRDLPRRSTIARRAPSWRRSSAPTTWSGSMPGGRRRNRSRRRAARPAGLLPGSVRRPGTAPLRAFPGRVRRHRGSGCGRGGTWHRSQGIVRHASYPGGTWRHAIAVGSGEILVDSRVSRPSTFSSACRRIAFVFPVSRAGHQLRQTDPRLLEHGPRKTADHRTPGDTHETPLPRRRSDGEAIASTVAQAQTTLNVATAGDQNMVDYINDYSPFLEKQIPA